MECGAMCEHILRHHLLMFVSKLVFLGVYLFVILWLLSSNLRIHFKAAPKAKATPKIKIERPVVWLVRACLGKLVSVIRRLPGSQGMQTFVDIVCLLCWWLLCLVNTCGVAASIAICRFSNASVCDSLKNFRAMSADMTHDAKCSRLLAWYEYILG